MKKLLLVATILFLVVSCDRSEDVKEKTTYENQIISKRSDSISVGDSAAVQSAAPEEPPVDPKDIVPPRH